MKTRTSFRQLVRDHHPLVTPAAHDAMSARMIEAAGFKAVAIGGLSMLAAQYGLPDIGLAGLAEMADGARRILGATTLPVGMDGDDGYGDVKSVARTVEVYETIGLGSIIFEDQDMRGKKPGEGQAVRVIEQDAMVKKLRAAVAARSDPETIILARTDTYRTGGLDEALRRADAYLKAGADGIFVASLSQPEELRHVGERLRGSIQICTVTERMLAVAPPMSELYDWGFRQIVFPHFMLARMTRAMDESLAHLAAIAAGTQPMTGVENHQAYADRLQALSGLARYAAIEERFG